MRPAADLPGSNDSLTFGFKGWECGPAPKVCAAMTQPERRGTQASPARKGAGEALWRYAAALIEAAVFSMISSI